MVTQYQLLQVYTSTKTGKGTDVLADYVAHRLLATPFTTRAQVTCDVLSAMHVHDQC